MAQVGYFAEEIVKRLDTILKKSAGFFLDGIKVSVANGDHYSVPEFGGFFYSFDFEDCIGFIRVDWLIADSSMRTFSVPNTFDNASEIEKNIVNPLLNAFSSEIRIQFFSKIANFLNIHQINVLPDIDFSNSLVLQLDLLQISPDDKKVIRIILPKELVFSILCSIQFPDCDTLSQSQIDGIVVNFTQKENVVRIDKIPDMSEYDYIGNSDFELPVFSEKEQAERNIRRMNCERLSFFMENVVNRMYKTFRDYRTEPLEMKVLYSVPCSDLKFAKGLKSSDFVVSGKVGGNHVYLKWNKNFFAKTFLGRKDDSKLERIECDIFRNEFAVPTFDALKSIVEVRVKKYLVVTSVALTDSFEKNMASLDSDDDGYLVLMSLKFGENESNASFYFPKGSVSMLENSGAFNDSEMEKIVKWQFPIGGFKNTDILIGSFIFDEHRFSTGKTFVLEREIGDTVELYRNSKLIARGEVFIRKGKKCILIKEVFGNIRIDGDTSEIENRIESRIENSINHRKGEKNGK